MEREREREEGKNDSVPQLHFFRGKNRSRNEKCYLPRLQLRVHTYTHTHTHALHTNPAPGRNRAISPFWVCSHLLEAHHPLPRMICMPRGRGAVPIYCLLLIDPLPFTNSPSKSSRSRVHAPFSVPSLSSITVVRLYQPPLPPPSIKSRPV